MVLQTETKIIIIKGGPGSGHRGHKGIPGHRGGSLPKGAMPKAIVLPEMERLQRLSKELGITIDVSYNPVQEYSDVGGKTFPIGGRYYYGGEFIEIYPKAMGASDAGLSALLMHEYTHYRKDRLEQLANDALGNGNIMGDVKTMTAEDIFETYSNSPESAGRALAFYYGKLWSKRVEAVYDPIVTLGRFTAYIQKWQSQTMDQLRSIQKKYMPDAGTPRGMLEMFVGPFEGFSDDENFNTAIALTEDCFNRYMGEVLSEVAGTRYLNKTGGYHFIIPSIFDELYDDFYNITKEFKEITIHKGGPGSGHRGHRGIPGHQGGSLPGGSAAGVITGLQTPYDYQDEHAEKVIHSDNWGDNNYRTNLMDAGDMFRALGVSYDQWGVDTGYFMEKVLRLKKHMDYVKRGYERFNDGANPKRLDELKQAYTGQPWVGEPQFMVLELIDYMIAGESHLNEIIARLDYFESHVDQLKRMNDEAMQEWAAGKRKANPYSPIFKQQIIITKGGPGSGHKGHRGIPGHQGGSLPGTGGSAAGVVSEPIPGYSAPSEHHIIITNTFTGAHSDRAVIKDGKVYEGEEEHGTYHTPTYARMVMDNPEGFDAGLVNRAEYIMVSNYPEDSVFEERVMAKWDAYSVEAKTFMRAPNENTLVIKQSKYPKEVRISDGINIFLKKVQRDFKRGVIDTPNMKNIELSYSVAHVSIPYWDIDLIDRIIWTDRFEPVAVYKDKIIIHKGGPGSGHKGHRGIPGHQGGSLPRGGTTVAYHRTTPEALEGIRTEGFDAAHFGHGAGLGMLEEPAGIFFSPEGMQGDFENEVKKRPELYRFTEVLKVEIPNEKIWFTDKKALREEFYKFREEWVKKRFDIDDPKILDLMVNQGNWRGLRDYVGLDAWDKKWHKAMDDYLDVNGEIEQKTGFSKWLAAKGYDGVMWEEGLYHVRQLVVFNLDRVRIINKEKIFKGGPGSGHRGHRGRPGKIGGSLPSGSYGGEFGTLDVAKGPWEGNNIYIMDSNGNWMTCTDRKYYGKGEAWWGEMEPYRHSELYALYVLEHPDEFKDDNDYYTKYAKKILDERIQEAPGFEEDVQLKANLVSIEAGFPSLYGKRDFLVKVARGGSLEVLNNSLQIVQRLIRKGSINPMDFGKFIFIRNASIEINPLEIEDISNFTGPSAFDIEKIHWKERKIIITKGGPGSGNFDHAGRPGKVGGSAPGKHGARPTKVTKPKKKKFDIDEWKKTEDVKARKDAWDALSIAERDEQADAKNSIPQRMEDVLSFAPKRSEFSGDVKADLKKRYDEIKSLTVEESGKLIFSTVDKYDDILSQAGVSDKDRYDLTTTALESLMVQDNEGLGRQLGDHGIHHILGNIEAAEQMMAAHPDPDTAKELATMYTALIYHDSGYLTPPSHVFLDEGHQRWSMQYYDTNIKPLISKALGDDAANEISHVIRTHNSTDIDWKSDVIASSTRVADNVALFHKEKLPPMFRYIPENVGILERYAAGEISVSDAKSQMIANIKGKKFSAPIEHEFIRGVGEINPMTPKLTLGMLGGEIAGFKWTGKYMKVMLRRNANLDKVLQVLDLGQAQFAKWAKTYGIDPNVFKTSLEFVFTDKDGNPLLASAIVEKQIRVMKGGPGSGYHGHPGGHYEGGKLARGGSRPNMNVSQDIFIGVPAANYTPGEEITPIYGARRNQPSGAPIRGNAVIAWDDPRIPETVYHVTTNVSGIKNSGEISARGEGGLGGDKLDQIVSMTIDESTAKQLSKDLKFAIEVTHKFYPDEPKLVWNEKTTKWESFDRKTGELVDRAVWATKMVNYMDRQARKEGWTFKNRVAPSQLFDYSVHDMLRTYFVERSYAAKIKNPIFFTESEWYMKMNPKNVGVISIPRRNLNTGALLVDFDLGQSYGLQEIRLYGDVPLTGAQFFKEQLLVYTKGGPGSGYHNHPGGHYEGGKLARGGSRSLAGIAPKGSPGDVWGGDVELRMMAENMLIYGQRQKNHDTELERTISESDVLRLVNFRTKRYEDLNKELKEGMESHTLLTVYDIDNNWEVVKRYNLNKAQMEYMRDRLKGLNDERWGVVAEKLGLPTKLDDFRAMMEKEGIDITTDDIYAPNYNERWQKVSKALKEPLFLAGTAGAALTLNRNEIDYFYQIYGDEIDAIALTDEKKAGRIMSWMYYFGTEMKNQSEFEIKHQIAKGNLDQEYAKEVLGYYLSSSDNPWTELPDELWHASTNADAIASDQIRSRRELGMQMGTGLGGGEDDTISFTTDQYVARDIERSLHEAQLVASGQVTLTELVDIAQKGGGGVGRPWIKEFISTYSGGERSIPSDSGFDFFTWQELPWKFKQIFAAEAGNMPEGWTREKLLEEVWDIYHIYYMGAREHAGGFMNPLFFSTDWRALSKLNPSNFKSLHYHPLKGSKGYKVSALGEWRTVGGDVVELEEVRDWYASWDIDQIIGRVK